MTKNKIFIGLLFTAIISFFSCVDKSNVGMGVLPEDALLKHTVSDTITLKTYTVLPTKMGGSGISHLLLGKITDPVFGVTEASTAVQVTVGTFKNFSDSLIADSVYLNLAYNNGGLSSYGDSMVTQTVAVYRMRKNILSDSIYYSNRNPSELHNNELLGTATLCSGTSTDSIFRIKLNDDLADFFLHPEDPDVYKYGDDFRAFFNGFVLQTEQENRDAAIVSFTLNKNSAMKVYYHWESDADSAREVVFPITKYCGRLNMFGHEYTNASVRPFIDDENANEYSFIQGMNGLQMKIELPFIKDLKKLGNVAIYKAEIVLEPANNENFGEENYPSSPSLIITSKDENGEYLAIPEYASENIYRGVELSEANQYRFDIGSYIYKVLNNTWKNEGLYVYGASDSQNFHRSVICGSAHENRAKLIITYSIL